MKNNIIGFVPVIFLAPFFLVACGSAGGVQPVIEDDPYSYSIDTGEDKTSILHETKKLTFLDSESVDIDISENMSKSYQQIELGVPSKFPLHEIPERLERWLAYIKKNNGEVHTVAVQDDGARRGVMLVVLEMAFTYLVTQINDDMYDPARNYNAKIYYTEATGKVERIVFYLRT